jgi:pimeloyl-ACP methyl ester carboxylesterase
VIADGPGLPLLTDAGSMNARSRRRFSPIPDCEHSLKSQTMATRAAHGIRTVWGKKAVVNAICIEIWWVERDRTMESLTREGRLLAFVDAGSGAPPVLLIHDLGSDHRSLRRLYVHLRRRHRVVAVDLPGHGKSGGPPTGYTVTELADDLDWLCWELGLYRPAALGQGIGGMVVVELAARHPDLLSAVVTIDAPVVSGEAARDERAEGMGAPPCLAVTWGLAEEWDEARALTLCRAPILFIETRLDHGDVERVRSMPPGVSVKVVPCIRLRPHEATRRINALIDAFLSTIEIKPSPHCIGPAG